MLRLGIEIILIMEEVEFMKLKCSIGEVLVMSTSSLEMTIIEIRRTDLRMWLYAGVYHVALN